MAVLLSFLLLIGVMPVTVTPVRAEDATQSEVNADAGTDVDADANADADADADVMPLAVSYRGSWWFLWILHMMERCMMRWKYRE